MKGLLGIGLLLIVFIWVLTSFGFSDQVPFRTWKIDSDELQSGWLDLTQQTTAPSAPGTGIGRIYYSSDGYLYLETSAGTNYKLVFSPVSSVDVGTDLDWSNFTNTMTLDATTTIDMDTNSANLDFDTANHTLYIDSVDNRIGIGTATPEAKLHLLGADNSIRLDYDGTNYVTISSDSVGDFQLVSSGSTTNKLLVNTVSQSKLDLISSTSSHLSLQADTDSSITSSEEAYLSFSARTTANVSFYNWYMGIDASDATKEVKSLYIGYSAGAWSSPGSNEYVLFNSLGDIYQIKDSGKFSMGSMDSGLIDNMENVSDWVSSDTTNTVVALSNDPVKVNSGALKITTVAGSSNGDTITKAFSAPQDFSTIDKIAFWIRSNVSGQIISIQLDDDTALTDPTHKVTISSANTWQYEVWDISSIAAADRDVVSAIKFIIDDDSSAPEIYIDQLRKYKVTTRGFEVFTDTGAKTVLFSNGGLEIPSNVEIISPGSFRLKGSARHVKIVRLSPEYPNVVFNADGTSNAGTLESMAESPDLGNNYVYTYYRWSTSQLTLQDYDIYVRWSVPSDFDGFPQGTNDALVVDIATATTLATDNAVDVYLYKDGAATTINSSILDKTSTSAGLWMTDQQGNAVIKFDDSDPVLSSLSAGDVLIIRIKLKANNTNAGWAKVGTIRIKYLSKW